MDHDILSYEAMSLAYDVAFEMSREFEKAYIDGSFDESMFPVLSGCYSAVDYFSNRIASLGTDVEEDVMGEQKSTLKDYTDAASIICGHLDLLRGSMADERNIGQVDYRKVQAFVGLQAVAGFIHHFTQE